MGSTMRDFGEPASKTSNGVYAGWLLGDGRTTDEVS